MHLRDGKGWRAASVVAFVVLAAMAFLLPSYQVLAGSAEGAGSSVPDGRPHEAIFSGPPQPEPMNAPPIADAGPDQFVAANTTVSLDGSASSDPDGDTLYYGWSQVSGPPVTLSGAGTAVASFVPTVPGVHTFRLGVWDDGAWVGIPPESFGLWPAWPGCCWEFPRVVVDATGNAMAVMAVDDFVYNVWAKRYVAGVGWEPAVLIEPGSGDSGYVDAAVDPSGNVIAVWRQWDGSRWTVQANRYVAGSVWEVAVPVTSDPSDAGRPHVAVDAAGNAMAVWRQWDGTNWSIRASRYLAGVGWGANALLESAPGEAWDPQVAVDPAGNAMAVWRQWDGTNASIWQNRYIPAVGWGTASLIESDSGDAASPRVGMDSAGNAIVVWQWFDGVATSIRANRYDVETGWGIAVAVESNSTDAWNPRLAVDPAGNAVAAWEGPSAIWASHYAVEVGWETPNLLHSDPGGYAALPEVSINSAGNAVVVWQGWLGPVPERVRAAPYMLGIGWGPSVPLEGYGDTLWFPQIAIDPAGYATVLMVHWDEPINAFDDIWASRFYAAGTGSSWDHVDVTVVPPADMDTYLYPIVGASSYYNTWDSRTGCTASTHHACVDEDPADEATSYVRTATAREKESHLMTDLSISSGYSDIDVTWEGRCQRSSAPSGGEISHLVRETDGKAEEDIGANKEFTCPSGSWSTFTFFMEESPGGGEWVPAEANALQCGYVSSTDVKPNPRVTRVRCRVQVTYPPNSQSQDRDAGSGIPTVMDGIMRTVEGCLATGESVPVPILTPPSAWRTRRTIAVAVDPNGDLTPAVQPRGDPRHACRVFEVPIVPLPEGAEPHPVCGATP